ncbi:NAD(P)/FAD-dependent oxidoreductase [Chloroflexota bacterium]
MFDLDAVIIGSGPAGVTAGLYLSRAGYRSLVIEKENYGGYLKNIPRVENYPGFPEGVSGPELATAMVEQATKYGLRFEPGEVTGIELYSGARWVGCTDGKGYTTGVIIITGGSQPRKLGIPGEQTLQGNGVFECALCDGGQFQGRVVAVCGGGEGALTEALYMARLASKVFIIHRRDQFRGANVLQERVAKEPKVEFVLNSVVETIEGAEKVESIKIRNVINNDLSNLPVDGILVAIGQEPDTGYLRGIIPLDNEGQVIVNSRMETEVPYILAAGNIRSSSPKQISAAVGDGAQAGITAQRLLQEIQ